MSRNFACLAFWTAVLSLGTSLVAQRSSTFTSFDFPGATATQPQGINATGEVVGAYTDSAGMQHGFRLKGGTFTSVDYPGAIATILRGINSNGDIVGTHVDAANLPGGGPRGFVLSQGAFTGVDYPGHLNTILQRITDDGIIYGCYHDNDTMGSMHGIQVNQGNFSDITTEASMSNGATAGGSVVAGLYTDMMTGVGHGYLASKDAFAPFDFPFSIATGAWDMSPSGEVVGNYRDTNKRVHGFLLKLDDSVLTFGISPQIGVNGSFSFETIDFPGATTTNAIGINVRGDVVGNFVDSAGKTHGYLLTRPRSDDDD